MKFLFPVLFALVCSAQGFAAEAKSRSGAGATNQRERSEDLYLGFGTSVPQNQNALIDPTGPSRSEGGEWIIIDFNQPIYVTDIALVGYSKTGAGQVLSHRVTATELIQNGISQSFDLPEMSHPGQAYDGSYQTHPQTGKIILASGNYVRTSLGVTLTRLVFQAEGFYNNDASLMIHLKSPEGFLYSDYRISRRVVNQQPVNPPSNPSQILTSGVYREHYPNPNQYGDMAIRTSGNVLFVQDGNLSFSMTCNWNNRTCFLRDSNQGQCHSFRFELINSRELYWTNPCQYTSGSSFWLGPL
ncbi:MAG: hypothetical protein ACK5WZ_03765 [Pseudobdellovibrionaceae bacterium]